MRFQREDKLGYWVNRVARKLLYGLSREFKEKGFNISAEQFALLNCLWIKDGKTQSEIANELEKDRTGITRIIDIMENNGFLERRNHENDRRSYRIFLTKKGRKIKNDLISIEMDWDDLSTLGLNDKQKKEIKETLILIDSNIIKYSENMK